MPMPTPRIDSRSYDDIVQQTSALVRHYTGWQASEHDTDAGAALIHIFGRMVEHVIERLNQVPEKNFLAFLDLIGTQLLPPKPAQVPLTFQLVDSSPTDALVPAHTQVAALPLAGEEEETIFETDSDLVVTRAQLVALFVHQPAEDRYDDYTLVLANTGDRALPVFSGAKQIEHSLYLARDDIFTLPGPKTIYVWIHTAKPDALDKLAIEWEYWDGKSWSPIRASHEVQTHLDHITLQWCVTMDNPPIPERTMVNKQEAAWVRARLNTALIPGATPPLDITITRIMAEVSVGNVLVPTRAFANSATLDLSKDFYPFGEQPKLGDAFYLALPEACAKPGAFIYVNLTLSDPLPVPLKASDNLEITWETWNGTAWKALMMPGLQSTVIKELVSVELPLPATLAPRLVNNETGYWLRARITQGNYGTAPSFKFTNDGKVVIKDGSIEQIGGYGAPSIASLTLRYVWKDALFTTCYSYNDFHYVDRTGAVATEETAFSPFTTSVEQHPALYLGFDHPFDNQPITLYLQVDPPQSGEIAKAVSAPSPNASPPRVIWEYISSTGWCSLGVIDETQAFAKSDVIRFIGPADFVAHTEFGQKRYWLRARWEDGTFLIPPRLRRVLTNTTWATQAVTMQEEILGSSTGGADQRFHTAQAPVLLGPRLEVREPDMPSAQDRALIEAEEGKDAISVTVDETGQPEEIWVRWHAVPDFYGSGPHDRHYVIDYLTGEVRFGDEQQGFAPPAGTNNVRMAQYRTSGGGKGNRSADSITQLKTSLPYIESVTNLETAEGGTDQEELAHVKERGPQSLRHRGRAVTVQDIEDLVHEAIPEVARARALSPDFDPRSLQWLPIFHLPLTNPGEIKVEAEWEGGQALAIFIHGPGDGLPYAQGVGKSKQTILYTVKAEQFTDRDLWRVIVMNQDSAAVHSGRIKITYPGDLIDTPLEVPARTAYTPKSSVRQGGRVELVIVPRSLAPQPTPSLALLARVKEYLLARCAPTLTLLVTEPDWVKVTVTAQVTPVSVAAAEGLQANIVAALERFLHPLIGGFAGSGWPFGRRPHVSDLYAAIEAIAGVDYVSSLAVVNEPSLVDIDPPQPGETAEDDETITRLEKERRDRFLIFSGRHQVTVVTAGDKMRRI